MTSVRQGSVGPWTLGDMLGRGGNASVWSATRTGSSTTVALKVIDTNKVEKEPYQRFVREIGFLRQHQDVPGLLHVIDTYLPDTPSRGDQPWLAMPIATPISKALRDRPLADVVGAAATLADTLWRLQRDFDIAHRDIKPGNLYELDGNWLIGDFGLVSVPEAAGLTRPGHQVGPAHYTAYEMYTDASTANPHSADVYSLGKTLWVLATDLRFPPEGHQPAGVRGFEVGDFRPHPHAASLDQEIDLMTRVHPEDRPSKAQVARDLSAWSQLPVQAAAVDVASMRVRVQAKLGQVLAEQDTRAQRKDLALAAIRRLQELTRPLNAALQSLGVRVDVDSASDKATTNLLKSFGRAPVVFRWHRCTIVAPLERPLSMTMRMGRSIELMDDGSLVLHLMVDVGPEGVMSSNFHWQAPAATAPVGTIQADQMLADGVAALAEAVSQGIAVLVDALPDVGDGT